MARSSAGGGRGPGGGRGQGGGRGSGRGNNRSDTENGGRPIPNAYQLHHEPNDGNDDEPVAVVGRGPVVPAPLPAPENRTWIWVENDEFNPHNYVSRNIGSNLKSLWSGPWLGWKDVPLHHRERLFERFQQYYQWKDDHKSLIHSFSEKCIKGKFPDLLKGPRDKAKRDAIQEGVVVGNDLTRILPFKPLWISQESWATLIGAWNTDWWKNKSSQNNDNRGKATSGRHTLGSKSYATVRKDLEKTLKRRAKFDEFWLQTHAKRGSRPLDRLSGCSKSAGNGSGEVNDVEETIEEHDVTWVDTRASEAYSTYNQYVIEKYGEDTSLHPEIDMELLSQIVGGKKKGRLYRTENIAEPPGRNDNDEVQCLKEKIAELEQDKIEKQAMMEKIEESARLYAEMNERIHLLSQKPPQNPPPT